MSTATTTIYIQLLNEGTPTARPAEAMHLGDNVYRILRPSDYDPEDEEWQFLPGSIVKCELTDWGKEPLLLATQLIK